MPATQSEHAWSAYRDQELQGVTPILIEWGYVLDKEQVHIGGERHLMAQARDVGGGGRKLVLLGTHSGDNRRVVIKVSSDRAGSAEITREREARALLHQLDFATRTFHSPQELFFGHHGPYLIYITAYIEEARSFFEHTLDEQFFLALRALEAQEGLHATTSRHAATIRETFGMSGAEKYLASYRSFARQAQEAFPEGSEMIRELARGEEFLKRHRISIERYSGFLTHADFVPNNLRVSGNEFYLLDYASLHFGNKYESWARFINFMTHHNAKLEELLVRYVRENRPEEESLSLRLMRAYKIAFLLQFYARALHHAEGNLRTLIWHRLTLWTAALKAVLDDEPVPREIIETYLGHLHALRSEEERARQREMLGEIQN